MFKELWQKLVDKVKSLLGIKKDKEAPVTDAVPAANAAPVESVDTTPDLQPEIVLPPTVQAYLDLSNPLQGLGGFLASDSYPAPFQATDFPLIAGQHEARILGNNQAFFFVKNPKGNTDPAQMTLDTTHLKTLIGNIYDEKTQFTLGLDADVTANPARFVEKYQNLRPETDQQTREALLGREVALIGGFIQSGGVRDLVKEVIAEKNEEKGQRLPANALDALTDGFLKNNLRVVGVQTAEALDAAVWQVEGPNGAMLAKQTYQPNTDSAERTWQIGLEPDMRELAEFFKPAASVLDAVQHANSLPIQNLLPAAGRSQAQAVSQQR